MKLLTIDEVQMMQLELMKKLHTYLKLNGLDYYLIAGSALGAVRHKGFIPWDDDIDIGMFREDYEHFLKICKEFDSDYDIVNFHTSNNCDFCLTRIYFKNTYIDDKTVKNTVLDKRLYFDIFPIDNICDDIDERIVFEKDVRKIKNLLERVDARNFDNSNCVMLLKNVISVFLKPFRKQILKKYDLTIKRYRNCDTLHVCSMCSQYSFKKQAMPRKYYGTPTLHTFADTDFYIPEQVDNYLTTLYGSDYMKVPPKNKRRAGHDIYLIDKE